MVKRKTPKRKTPKRKTPKRKTPKRKTPKRKTPKRKTPKRSKRKTPKRSKRKTPTKQIIQVSLSDENPDDENYFDIFPNAENGALFTQKFPQICFTRYNIPWKDNYVFCIDQSAFPNLILQKFLGRGFYGTVFEGLYDKNRVAVKFVTLGECIFTKWLFSREDFYAIHGEPCYKVKDFGREQEYALLFSKLNVTPKVFYAGVAPIVNYSTPEKIKKPLKKPKGVGVIIMEQAGITLLQFAQEFPQKFKANKEYLGNQFVNLHRILFSNGIKNEDDHTENILVNPDTLEMKFIDILPYKITPFFDEIDELNIREHWDHIYERAEDGQR